MQTIGLILTGLLWAGSGHAGGHQALFGAWGTKAQCAGDLLLDGGSLRAAPMEISEAWLKHRTVWCSLTWYPVQPRVNGAFAPSVALCGEDSQRRYRVDFVLADDELRIVWDEVLVNGPMGVCAQQ